MGELHLEIIVDRLLREFKVEANVGAPQVAYRETITQPVDVEYKYSKQSGGRGQYGHVKIRVIPQDPGTVTSSKTKLLVDLYQKNTLDLLMQVSKVQWHLV